MGNNTFRAKGFLNPTVIGWINEAVRKAELKTAGEIKVMVVEKSSPRWVISRRLQAKEVNRRAVREFYAQGLDHTVEHTGVLIMISLREHRVVVLGGKAINDKFPDQRVWAGVVKTILDRIKAGRPGRGIEEGVLEVGRILAEHFPIKPGDRNEISDELIIKK